MIEIYKLTKRHIDGKKKEYAKELKHIVTFSQTVGHGVGTIDFSEKIYEMSETEFSQMITKSGQYAKFKLGNIDKFYEIEIFPEHASRLLDEIPSGKFREILENLDEGYLMLRKNFDFYGGRV